MAPLGSKSGKYGGPFETSLAQVKLVEQKFESTLLAPHLQGDRPIPELEFAKVISPKIRQRSGDNNFLLTFSWVALAETIKQIRQTDIVHLSFAREFFPVFCAMVSLVMRKKLVIQSHGMLTSRTSITHKLTDMIILPLFRLANCYVALTEIEKRELTSWANVDESRIFVIGNPTQNLDKQSQEADVFERGTVTFIARLHKRKRVIDFAKAAKISKTKGQSALFLVGGPDQGDLEDLMPYVERRDVQYIGALSQAQVIETLSSSKVFVLCSQNEPWGNVLVSALKIGIPVVVTASSHLASLIEENQAGVVVADNSPVDLASGISSILEMTFSQYSKMVKNAKSVAQEHMSNEAICKKLTLLYMSTFASNCPRQ